MPKRNMDLIRQIAFLVESAKGGINSSNFEVDGCNFDEIQYHCELMADAGLIDAPDEMQTLGSTGLYIQSLTWSGHDFIDAARSDTLWQKAKTKIAATVGAVSIDVMVRYLKEQAAQMLGLSTGQANPPSP